MKQHEMLGPGHSGLVDVPIPRPGPGEVLVKVKYCGVCRSEYEAWLTAQPGRRFGHEAMGHIAALGEGVQDFQIGDRVSGLSHPALAEYVIFSARHTAKVPAGIRDADAAFEPLACLVSAASKLPVPTVGDAAVVVGCGYMGLGAVSLLKLKGAGRIIAIDARAEALQAAHSLGATECFLPGNIPADCYANWDNNFKGGFPLVSEWGGNNATLDLAGRLCAIGGTLAIGAYHAGERRLVDMQLWNYKAMNVVMAHERDPDRLFQCGIRAYEMLSDGRWPFFGLKNKVYALDQFDLAMEESSTKPGGLVKGIIDCTRLSNRITQQWK